MRAHSVGLLLFSAWAVAAPLHVPVIEHDGSSYARAVGGANNVAPRRQVARTFFQTHSDQYDFLIVFPTFPADFGAEVAGVHFGVSNEVTGLGLSTFSSAQLFGSAGRLKGYVDVASLIPGNQVGAMDATMGVVAHEIAHQWSGQAKVLLPGSSSPTDDLLGSDGVHWSFFLDSNASVLYGSKWATGGSPGSFSAVESRRRYSDLDLYLMGFLSPLEVQPMSLLRPTGPGHLPTDLPPPDGTVVAARVSQVTIANVTDALGPRVPAAPGAQHEFRAAFVVLTAPGVAATPAQLAFVDQARREFSNQFFFLTRGRGVMQTELVDVAPSGVSSSPSVNKGVSALLALQKPDGRWADNVGTSARETTSALEALSFFSARPDVSASSALGADWLSQFGGATTDAASRKVMGLVAARRATSTAASALDLLRSTGSTAYGLAPGYSPTVIDSALAAVALHQSGRLPATLAPLRAWLLGRQAADGGWPLTVGGPSRIESTALVLRALLRLGANDAASVHAASLGFGFLRARRNADGSFRDDLPSASATSLAVVCLSEWGQLTADEGATASAFLLSQQLTDGSWAGSAYQTAEAIKALRAALTVNVSIATADVTLSSGVVAEGEPVVAQALVRNTGLTQVSGLRVQAFDSNGAALSAVQPVADIAPGSAAPVTLRLATAGHVGSSQVFIVADPEGAIDESREDDNRAALALLIKPPSQRPDAFVSAGSVSSAPPQIRGASTLQISAEVGNSGLASVPSVAVSLLQNGLTVATTTLALPARSTVPVVFSVAVSTGPAQFEVVVDPSNAIEEESESNNRATLIVPVLNVIDLTLSSLTAVPSSARQGTDILLNYQVQNRGTVDGSGAVTFSVLDATGSTVATLVGRNGPVAAGATVSASATWRAVVAGSLTVVARVTASGDVDSSNDTASIALEVSASPLPNLVVRLADLTVAPSPLLEGQGGTVSATVRNNGGGVAGAFDVDLYSGDPAQGGVLLGHTSVSGLARNGAAVVTAPLPVQGTAALNLVAVVDPGANVEEFDEDDNKTVATFTPASRPDLVIGDGDVIPADPFPRVGDRVPVRISVLNQGAQDAQNVVVELFVGSTTSTPVGTATLATIAARGRADAQFSLSTNGLSGTQVLIGVVNSSHAVTEGRYDNNTGRRDLVVQDGAVALTNPYFSPNGDGVKDTTAVLARAPGGATLEVEINDAVGGLVRRLSGVSPVVWDGLDDLGVAAEDAEYRVTAWALLSGQRTLIGTTTATLDTNHLLVTATAGTAFFRRESGSGAPTPDDEGVLFDSTFPDSQGNPKRGFYFRGVGGGETRLVSPSAWTSSELGGAPVMSPDGRHFANTVNATLRLTDFILQTSQTFATAVSGAPIFNSNGRSILYLVSATVGSTTERHLDLLDVQLGSTRTLASFATGTPSDYRFSPDGSMVSYVWQQDLYVLPVAGGVARKIIFGAPTGRVDPLTGPVVGAPVYAWRASSKELVYSTPGTPVLVEDPTRCFDIVYGRNSENRPPSRCYLSAQAGIRSYDLASSTERVVFSDPTSAFLQFGSRWPLFGTQGSLLASPFGRTVVFPYSPVSTPWRLALDPPVAGLRFVDDANPDPAFLSASAGRLQGGVTWSPGGTFIVTDTGQILSSDANLRARVNASRPPGGGRLSIGGDATDWNFDQYELSVRPVGNGSSTVLGRSTVLSRNSKFLEWTPSAPGLYELALQVTDKAGNTRRATAQAGWNTSPAISSLSVEPQLFSPNGDNEADSVRVGYFANGPVTTDFVISNDAGVAVRDFQRTHLTSGSFALNWDGRDEAGQVVVDGTYQLAVENLSAAITVDTVAPAVTLELAPSLPAAPNRQFVAGQRLARASDGFRVEFPSVLVNAAWLAADDHLQDWAVELSDPLAPNRFSTTRQGTDQQLKAEQFPIPSVRGRTFRLRARDAAGNVALSGLRAVPDRLFVTAIKDADALLRETGSLVVDGVNELRIDKMSAHYGPQMEPRREAGLSSSRLAFALESTVGVPFGVDSPFVAYAVAYRPLGATTAFQVDTANVSLLSPHVLMWDARFVSSGSYEVEVRATDSTGRQFADSIEFRADPGLLGGCVVSSGGTGLKTVVHEDSPSDPFVSGTAAIVEVGGSTPLASAPLGALNSTTQAYTPVPIVLPVQGSCEYELLVSGTTRSGASRSIRSSPIEVCGLHLAAIDVSATGVLSLDLEETFAKAITSVDVVVDGRTVGTAGQFNGWTHFSTALPSATQCNHALVPGFVTHFADGTTATTNYATQGNEYVSSNGQNFCEQARVAQFSCEQPTLLIASTTPTPAPRCNAQLPQYQLTATGTAISGQTLRELALSYVARGVEFQLAGGSVPGLTSATVTGALDSMVVPEGTYQPRATLVQSDGARVFASGASIIVDKTPPVVGVSNPRVGARVCPSSRRNSFGVLESVLSVSGVVADANLVGEPTVSIQGTATAMQSLTVISTNPVVAELPAPQSGDYEVVVEGRDVSGSSSCAAVPFHFVAPVRLTSAQVVPSLFSPDGDGRLDSAALSFATSEPATVVVRATAAGGSSYRINELSTGAGGSTLSWDGRDENGVALPDGVYELAIAATDECGSSAEQTVRVTIDRVAPVARIDTPAANALVAIVLNVAGEASDEHFDRATLRLVQGGSSSVLSVSSLPTQGAFGGFPLAGLTSGQYDVTLEVTDLAGHTSTTSRSVTIGPARLLADVTAAPLVISPNGDGRVDTALLGYNVLSSASVQISLRLGASTVRPLAATGPVVGAQLLSLDAALLGTVADNLYTIHLEAQDASGTESADVPLIVDLTAPTAVVNSPSAQQFVPGRTGVLGEVSDLHLATWTLAVTSGGATVPVANGTGPVSGAFATVSALSDGPVDVELLASDLAGNRATTVVHVISDSVAPLVSFRSPLSGSFVSGLDGGTRVDVEVVEPAIASVVLSSLAGSGPARVVFAGTALPPAGFSWNSQLEADGPTSLRLTVTDRAGNEATAAVGVTVDNTPPLVGIDTPNATVLAQPGRFTGTASDLNLVGYLLEVAAPNGPYFVVGSGTQTVTSSTLATLATSPADGAYNARLTATDKAGNQSIALSPFTADNTPPDAPVLSVARAGPSQPHLTWAPSVAADVAAYVLRRTSNGVSVELPALTASDLEFDEQLPDGEFSYVVFAVDGAGLRSPVSNSVSFVADSTPPTVAIFSPVDGSRVSASATMSVTGTAAAQDLADYRLSLGTGLSPSAFTLLVTSHSSVRSAVIDALDTASLSPGASYTLRLEATDVNGNLAVAISHFTVDDGPPAAPVLVSAIPGPGSLVVAQWQLSPEPDVVGYLVYRNFQLANGPAGSVANPLPYALPAGTSTFTNSGLPDGLFSYRVRALDAAGNLSDFSNEITATLNERAPIAVVVLPGTLDRVAGPTSVVVDSVDEDIASIRLEMRAGGQGAWTQLALLQQQPWVAQFDPTTASSPVIELRATATDTFGATDSNPKSTTFFFDPPLLAVAPSALVTADRVAVRWTDPNPPARVAGYRVDPSQTRIPRIGGTATAPSGLAASGYDDDYGTRWVSSSAFPQLWELEFTSPVFTDSITASFGTRPTLDLELRVRGVWITAQRALVASNYSFAASLGSGLEVEAIRLRIASDLDGHTELYELVATPRVSRISPQTVAAGLGPVAINVTAKSPFGSESVAPTAAVIYQPTLSSSVSVTSDASVVVSGSAQPGDTVEIRRSGGVIATLQADGTGQFSGAVPLPSSSALTAIATNAHGDRSIESSVLYVDRASSPTAQIELSLTSIQGSDVNLAFVVTGSLSNLTAFVVSRSDGTQSAVVGFLGTSARTFTDSSVRNGTYRYSVAPFNAGITGTPSNEVTAVVNVSVDSPIALTVSSVPKGNALGLQWVSPVVPPSGGFAIERGDSATGPFSPLNGGLTVATTTFQDVSLTNGQEYWYRVFAIDGLGNRSPPSNLASGIPADSVRPGAPRITAPTTPAVPLATTAPTTTVRGFAEAGSQVTLTRNGTAVGTRGAGANETLKTPVTPAVPSNSVYAASPDGRFIATGSSTPALVIENAATHARVNVAIQGGFPVELAFSPDGNALAVVVLETVRFTRHLFVASVATGVLTPVEPGATSQQSKPVWSPDSSRLAYSSVSADFSTYSIGLWASGVAVQTFSDVGVTWGAPVTFFNSQLVALGYVSSGHRIVSIDLQSSVRTTLLSSTGWDSVRGSPGHSLLVLNDYTDVISTFDIATGAQVRVGVGTPLQISPDGTQLVWYSGPPQGGQFTITDLSDFSSFVLDGTYSDNDGMQWLGSALLHKKYSTGQLQKIEWGGPFEFPNVPLVSGDNFFVAVSRDQAANLSPQSAAIQVTLDASALADLTPSLSLLPSVPIATQPASALVSVRNLGGVASAAADIAATVRGSDGSIRRSMGRAPAIAVGQSALVSIPIDVTGLSGAGQTLSVTVDPNSAIADVSRPNNTAELTFIVAANANLALSVSAQPPSVQAFGDSTITVELFNPGITRNVDVSVSLTSPDGTTALLVSPPAQFAPLAAGDTQAFTRSLNVGSLLAGDYLVVAEATSAGQVLGRATTPFRVEPSRSATVAVATNRATYLEGELTSLNASASNTSLNVALVAATLQVEVVDSTSATVFTSTSALPSLPPGGTLNRSLAAPSAFVAGNYLVRATLFEAGIQVAASTATFAVTPRALLRGELVIQGAAASPVSVAAGTQLGVSTSVTNGGSAAAESVEGQLMLSSAAGIVSSQTFTVGTLNTGVRRSNVSSLSTTGLANGVYSVSLLLSATGVAQFVAATSTIQIVDADPPSLTILGIAQGALVSGRATARVQARDVSGVAGARVSVDGVLSALSAASGSARDGEWSQQLSLADGPHTLVFSAVDVAGNDGALTPRSDDPVTVSFETDATPPVIAVTGAVSGNQIVTPQVVVTDAHPGSLVVTLNGAPFAPGSQVAADGRYELFAVATDAAGNQSSRRVTFELDRTAPIVTALGFTDGAFVNSSVSPDYAISDAQVFTSSATLDGVPFVAGSVVSSEGTHRLDVLATDLAGNEGALHAQFTIDLTPPQVSLAGFVEGEVTARTVVPTATATAADANLLSLDVRLDAARFSNGASVSSEGEHRIDASALDKAGNLASATGRFVIDRTAPTVAISGVADGDVSQTAVTPVIQVADLHLASTTVTLDGSPFVSGTVVSSPGDHLLIVSAVDSAGNSTSQEVHFRVDTAIPLSISLGGFTERAVVRGPVTPTVVTTGAVLGVSATLNAQPFLVSSSVSADGDYELIAVATGVTNSVTATGHFTIDGLAPDIAITGVVDGQISRGSVVPVIAVTELHPSSETILLNGAPFASGTSITTEGVFTLSVVATDAAGNSSSREVHFTIDSTPPSIVITGVVDGQVSVGPLTPLITVSDTNLSQALITLDGAPFVSGSAVVVEGRHDLVVVATDTAGNSTTASRAFTIDRTAPLIVIAGVSQGQVSSSALVPLVTIVDTNLTSAVTLLNGNAFSSGTPVVAEGDYVLSVLATDAAGNSSSANVSFSIDRTAPVLALTGFANGSIVRGPVSPNYTVTELHVASVSATLNGASFVGGTAVVNEGAWTLSVTARDTAGNSTTASGTFTVDTTAPVITITGVTPGQLSGAALVPVINVTDLHAVTNTIRLNGAPFVSGTAVGTDGDYTLSVSSVDAAGNSASKTITFTVDRTAPTITIVGVSDGAVVTTAVTPVIQIQDAHPSTSSATLNGAAFTSGTAVSAAGSYTLTASATDALGNTSTVTVHFTIQPSQVGIRINKGALGPFARTLALIDAHGCRVPSREVSRVEAFVRTALGGPTQIVNLTWTQPAFLTELRSGQYNVYLVMDLGLAGCEGGHDDDDDGHDDDDHCGDDHHGDSRSDDDGSRLSLRADSDDDLGERLSDELREQVFGGHAGLVVVSPRELGFDVKAVTGVGSTASTSATIARFSPGPIAPPVPLSVVGRARSLRLTSATSLALYGNNANAAAFTTFGQGRAATFGFDLTTSGPSVQSQLTLARAVTAVTPAPGPASALAVTGVRVEVQNSTTSVNATVIESLSSPLFAVDSLPLAGVSLNRRALTWQVPLSPNQSVPLIYWARLPDQLGSWSTSTEVRTSGAPVTLAGTLATTQSGANLAFNALSAAQALSTSGRVGAARALILSRLAQVQSRRITRRSDVELNLTDLLSAAAAASEVPGSAGSQARAQLDHLILYWEARWYVY